MVNNKNIIHKLHFRFQYLFEKTINKSIAGLRSKHPVTFIDCFFK